MRYLTIEQLRAKLGNRSRTSIYRDIEARRLPKPLKFASRPMWREDEIDALMEATRETVEVSA